MIKIKYCFQVVPSASEFSQSPVIFMPGTVGPQQRSQTPPSTVSGTALSDTLTCALYLCKIAEC